MPTRLALEEFDSDPPPLFTSYPPGGSPSDNFAYDLGFSLQRLNGNDGVRVFSYVEGATGGTPRESYRGPDGGMACDAVGGPHAGETLLPATGSYSGWVTENNSLIVTMAGPSNGMGAFFHPARSNPLTGPFAASTLIQWSQDNAAEGWGGSMSVAMPTDTSLSVQTAWYRGSDSEGSTYTVTLPTTLSRALGPWLEIGFNVYDGFFIKVAAGTTLFAQAHPWEFPDVDMTWALSAYGGTTQAAGFGTVQLDHVYGYVGRASHITATDDGVRRIFS